MNGYLTGTSFWGAMVPEMLKTYLMRGVMNYTYIRFLLQISRLCAYRRRRSYDGT